MTIYATPLQKVIIFLDIFVLKCILFYNIFRDIGHLKFKVSSTSKFSQNILPTVKL